MLSRAMVSQLMPQAAYTQQVCLMILLILTRAKGSPIDIQIHLDALQLNWTVRAILFGSIQSLDSLVAHREMALPLTHQEIFILLASFMEPLILTRMPGSLICQTWGSTRMFLSIKWIPWEILFGRRDLWEALSTSKFIPLLSTIPVLFTSQVNTVAQQTLTLMQEHSISQQ